VQFIQNTTKPVVRSVADAMERMRGIVLSTGRATIANVDGFTMDDGFGRSRGHDLVAGTLWDSATSVSRLAYLQTIIDTYTATTVRPPARSSRRRRCCGHRAGRRVQDAAAELGVAAGHGGDVNATSTAYSFPPITVYDRNVKVAGSTTRVTAAEQAVPAPGRRRPQRLGGHRARRHVLGTDAVLGRAGLEHRASEQPGIVVGAYRNEKPPMIAEVIPDAIGLPVLANADLSLAAQVIT
jgi:hypothetical protein